MFWVSVPEAALPIALARLPRLGYAVAADLLEPLTAPTRHGADGGGTAVRWRGETFRLRRVYDEDPEEARGRAPDRRTFLLETSDGTVRAVTGYRGDGQALSRRGLPVCDARLLVNLVHDPRGGELLDPFAGVGGVAIEALASGWRVRTADIDPALRHGLAHLGAQHEVADARELSLEDGSVAAVATEPPYDPEAAVVLGPALREMYRVLRPGGGIAVLCTAWQAEELRREADTLGLHPFLDCPIDRKGTPVVALAWRKG